MSEDAYGTEPGDPSRARLLGGVGAQLSERQVATFVEQALAGADLDDKRICLVVPDRTRTCPLPLILGAVHRALVGRAKEVTVLIALGTHQAMSEQALGAHLGYGVGDVELTYPGWEVVNHESWLPETFTTLGTIGRERMSELTGGLMTDLTWMSGSTGGWPRPMSRSWSGPCSPMRWWASRGATSTSSPECPDPS